MQKQLEFAKKKCMKTVYDLRGFRMSIFSFYSSIYRAQCANRHSDQWLERKIFLVQHTVYLYIANLLGHGKDWVILCLKTWKHSRLSPTWPAYIICERKDILCFKGTRSPFERCDLVDVKHDFIHELFQRLCKRGDDNIQLTVSHYPFTWKNSILLIVIPV